MGIINRTNTSQNWLEDRYELKYISHFPEHYKHILIFSSCHHHDHWESQLALTPKVPSETSPPVGKVSTSSWEKRYKSQLLRRKIIRAISSLICISLTNILELLFHNHRHTSEIVSSVIDCHNKANITKIFLVSQCI